MDSKSLYVICDFIKMAFKKIKALKNFKGLTEKSQLFSYKIIKIPE